MGDGLGDAAGAEQPATTSTPRTPASHRRARPRGRGSCIATSPSWRGRRRGHYPPYSGLGHPYMHRTCIRPRRLCRRCRRGAARRIVGIGAKERGEEGRCRAMADVDSAGIGIRASVRRHRLIVFGALVIALTVAALAAHLGEAATPFALAFVPFMSALIVDLRPEWRERAPCGVDACGKQCAHAGQPRDRPSRGVAGPGDRDHGVRDRYRPGLDAYAPAAGGGTTGRRQP